MHCKVHLQCMLCTHLQQLLQPSTRPSSGTAACTYAMHRV